MKFKIFLILTKFEFVRLITTDPPCKANEDFLNFIDFKPQLFQNHQIQTQDGYILKTFNLNKNSLRKPNQEVVVLIHDVLHSSDD